MADCLPGQQGCLQYVCVECRGKPFTRLSPAPPERVQVTDKVGTICEVIM